MGIVDKKTIDDFYANKKIAVIGASRKKMKYGGMLVAELKARDYDVIPVNPSATEIQGVKAYSSVKDVKGVNAAIAVVPPAQQDKVVEEAASAGIKTIWLHEHVMKGISNPKALYIAEEKGMNVIAGLCPMMFMPKTGFPHNIHKGIMKLFGALPR